jgi:hypothetical protein
MQYELGTQIRQILEDFYWARRSERDSSGTTEAHEGLPEMREGDGADSPTRAPNGREAARPNFNVRICKPSHELVLK